MPEARLARARGTLPPGFQFGDGGKPRAAGIAIRLVREFEITPDPNPVRVDYGFDENGYLVPLPPTPDPARGDHWNTIEAED